MANLIFSNRKKTHPKNNDPAADLRWDFVEFVLGRAEKSLLNDDILLNLIPAGFGSRIYHDNNCLPGPHQAQFENALLSNLEPVNESKYKR